MSCKTHSDFSSLSKAFSSLFSSAGAATPSSLQIRRPRRTINACLNPPVCNGSPSGRSRKHQLADRLLGINYSCQTEEPYSCFMSTSFRPFIRERRSSRYPPFNKTAGARSEASRPTGASETRFAHQDQIPPNETRLEYHPWPRSSLITTPCSPLLRHFAVRK